MIKIWFKIILDEKILVSDVISVNGIFSADTFRDCIEAFCEKHNEPTPVILTKHITHFEDFNSTAFLKTEFLENVSFDKLVLENAVDA